MAILDGAAAARQQWAGRTVGGMDLPTVMLAIAGAESGWRNDAAGDAGGSEYACQGRESWGLWQIHMAAHHPFLRTVTGSDSPCAWATWLIVPANAARAADAVIRGSGQDLPLSALRPWTVWFSQSGNPNDDAGDGNGMWRQHLARAQEAMAQVAGAQPPLPAQPPVAEPPLPAPLPPVAAADSPSQAALVVLGLVAVGTVALGAALLTGRLRPPRA